VSKTSTATTNPLSPWPEHVAKALSLPNGARFYRAALQVNPFAYLGRHAKKQHHPDEASYNAALIAACKAKEVEVIAVTDHYRIRSAERLIREATDAGLHVFPGFEASTSDGIHFLCIFEKGRPASEIERLIGNCGIYDESKPSPIGSLNSVELLTECQERWNGLCIAAHAISDSGILHSLQGQPRMEAWRHPGLLACSIAGSVPLTPQDKRPILENKNPHYKRSRRVTVLNSQDVSAPEDLDNAATTCWIKMSEVSLRGLRLAFLDQESRVRLAADPAPEEHAEFLALGWQGGFLDGVGLHFNENLNALVGGRGTGKSTIIESVRFVLNAQPLGEDAARQHKGFIESVLKSGTTVSLLVRSHHPSKSTYLIERTVAGQQMVKDAAGKVLKLLPRDVLPQSEVYGQHEISELAREPAKLTRLLERFVARDPNLATRKADLRKRLLESREQLLAAHREIKHLDESLAKLPALQETQRRFVESGVADRLREQALLVKEEAILKSAEGKIKPVKEAISGLASISLKLSELDDEEAKALPGYQTLLKAGDVLTKLSREIGDVRAAADMAVAGAASAMLSARTEWTVRQQAAQQAYETLLRELQREKIDGQEFISLESQIAYLRPLQQDRSSLLKRLDALEAARRSLLADWEDTKSREFREIASAAKKVDRELGGRVSVEVKFGANRQPLERLLRTLQGRLAEAIDVLDGTESLSLSELAASCRKGRDAILQKLAMPRQQAEILASAGEEFCMLIEELDLEATTTIRLNIAAEGRPPVWKALNELSTGQKATAVLLLLLLESDGPLVVDQPEDDLDNRFITEGIVPTMRVEKRRRQFIFATHNANIPVLGDAELIVGLTANGEAASGRASILPTHMASIDAEPVKELVEEILEGGKVAFETRRLKYGF
jgi:energy-coupling factor transporter ATP-binding protein EcfA2